MNIPHKLALIGVGIMCLAAVGVAEAQVKTGKSRALKTSQWMKCVMKPQCEALKKGLDGAPSNDAQWQDLAASAALINEASYLLMDDGRCPDGVWAEAASKTLRNGSEDVLKAIETKDLAAAKAGFASMTKACGACHDKHKEKK